jgi:hypothetical protein
MKLKNRGLSFFVIATAMLLVGEINFGEPVEARRLVQNFTTEAGDTSQGTIVRAMSAGPDEIARSARY